MRLNGTLKEWARLTHYSGDLERFMEFWFQRDQHPDRDLLLLVQELSQTHVRQIIATNNEDHRTRFIEQDMGMKNFVEQIFASGAYGSRQTRPALLSLYHRSPEGSGLSYAPD